MTLQQFCQTAEDDLVDLLGHETVSARLREASTGGMARFLGLACLALDIATGRLGGSRHAHARIVALPVPSVAALPAAVAPTPPAPPPATMDLNKLRRLAVEVLGSASISQSDTLEEIQKRFQMEGLTLPGMPASTRELFGSQRYVRAARQATIDAFFVSGKTLN